MVVDGAARLRSRSASAAVLALSLGVSMSRSARAQDTGVEGGAISGWAPGPHGDEGDQRHHLEIDPVPLIGGNTDIGWGGGAVVVLAEHDPGFRPYRWDLELSGMTTVRPPSSGDGWAFPYQDYYAAIRLPHLLRDEVSLEAIAAYTNEETLKYYGLGDASKVGPIASQTDPYYEFRRIHPTVRVDARLHVSGPFYVVVGDAVRYSELQVSANTRLAQDQRSGSPEVRSLLGSFQNAAFDLFEYELMYDTRDDTQEATRGMAHRATLRLSPGGSGAFPYRYGEAGVNLRAYVTPIPNRLTLAARLVGDWQFGDVPFYELAGFEETYAIGGVQGVRGPPAQRYYGRQKVFGNLEARSTLLDFHLFGKPFAAGVVAFVDGGRVWADGIGKHPELDGTGLGLAYGIGGGLRLHQGRAMVVRFDVAWSPDAQPVGAYFSAGEIF
jgi:outer membrane protein assembly factor BamA